MNIALNKSLTKILLAASFSFLIPGTAVNAFAAREPAGSTMYLTKNINISGKYSYIDTSFGLSIASGASKGANTGIDEANSYAGISGGLSAKAAAVSGMFSGNTTSAFELSTDHSVFVKPGVYHYTLKENDPAYDGVSADTRTYDVYLYVINAAEGSALSVNDIVIYAPDGKSKISSITNTYTTKSVTLKKTITGNAAYMDGKWDFTITISGQEGDKYTVVQNGALSNAEIADGETTVCIDVTLGKDETVTVYGLSESDTYSMIENAAGSDGYTTSVAYGEASGHASDNTVIFNNHKETTVSAGLNDGSAQGLIFILSSAGAAAIFTTAVIIRRKHAS
jgi:hypothetical protein